MPQLEAPNVRVSRQSVRVLWLSYVTGLGLSVALMAAGAAGGRSDGERWSLPALLCAGAGVLAAVLSFRLTAGLPDAQHRIFDTVGRRFEFAIRQLFLRFVLAGAAAEAAGILGAVVFYLAGSLVMGGVLLAAAFVLLIRLRRRVAPLVHYLA